MTARLPIGTRVIVTLPGLHGKQKNGVIVEPELVKGYWVLLEWKEFPERFPDKKVKRSGRPPTKPDLDVKRAVLLGEDKQPADNQRDDRPPTRLKIPDAMASFDSIVLDGYAFPGADRLGVAPLSERCIKPAPGAVPALTLEVSSFPRPSKPEQSEAYKAWIRTLECCNCGTPGPGDPHHEGKKGVSQKVRDTLCVPLCRPCHTYYTATNRLPDQELSNRAGKIVSRSRDESLAVLQGAQAHLVAMAFERLPLALRVEVLSKALAGVGEDVLRQALR